MSPRAPRPSPALNEACRTENTADRPAGPAIGRDLPDANEHLGNGVDLCDQAAAITLQQLPHSGAGHQPPRQQPVERRELERAVAEDLDRSPAVAERYQWAEYGVFDEPDEKLHSVRAAYHRLHQKSVEACSGMRLLHALDHRRCLPADLIGIAKI